MLVKTTKRLSKKQERLQCLNSEDCPNRDSMDEKTREVRNVEEKTRPETVEQEVQQDTISGNRPNNITKFSFDEKKNKAKTLAKTICPKKNSETDRGLDFKRKAFWRRKQYSRSYDEDLFGILQYTKMTCHVCEVTTERKP